MAVVSIKVRCRSRRTLIQKAELEVEVEVKSMFKVQRALWGFSRSKSRIPRQPPIRSRIRTYKRDLILIRLVFLPSARPLREDKSQDQLKNNLFLPHSSSTEGSNRQQDQMKSQCRTWNRSEVHKQIFLASKVQRTCEDRKIWIQI